MIEFGKDHSPAWLELMSAYQIFRARLFDWSREPDQVKQRDLLLELGSWENRDLNRRTLVADLLRSAEMWDEKALLLVQKELTAIALQAVSYTHLDVYKRQVFALIERELRQCKLDSAAMKPVEALDGKL